MEIKTFTGQRRSGLTHTVLTRARAAGPFVLVVTKDSEDYARFKPAAVVTTLGRHREAFEARVETALRAGARLVVIDDAHAFGRAYATRLPALLADYGAVLWIAGNPPTKPDHWFAKVAEKYPPEVIAAPPNAALSRTAQQVVQALAAGA